MRRSSVLLSLLGNRQHRPSSAVKMTCHASRFRRFRYPGWVDDPAYRFTDSGQHKEATFTQMFGIQQRNLQTFPVVGAPSQAKIDLPRVICY